MASGETDVLVWRVGRRPDTRKRFLEDFFRSGAMLGQHDSKLKGRALVPPGERLEPGSGIGVQLGH
jgi:hypothetical protein